MLSDELKYLPIKSAFLYLTENEYRLPSGDLYEFGVYNGKSLELIIELEKKYNVLGDGWIVGIDSFQGLPISSDNNFEKFKEGSYKSDFTYTELVVKFFPEPVSIIKEWYKDLTKVHVKDYDMRPAKLIYIDCDIYESAVDALRFMFENKLVQVGTIICYDEFKTSDLFTGEERAHHTIMNTYNCEVEEIWRWKYIDKDLKIPVLQKIFEVTRFN